MLPKSYLIWKWTVYSLATALLFGLQSLVLNQVQVLGVTPFLYPMLPAVLASYEGSRRGPTFALCLGVVCDLLLPGPFEGFFTLVFPLVAVLAALIAEKLLSPGALCGFVVSTMALLLTGALRIFVLALPGSAIPWALMGRILLLETVLSLPALAVVGPLYQVIHRRCASDY